MSTVGISMWQLKKMVIAEVASYPAVGILMGGALGSALHKFFFAVMVPSNWGDAWQPPVAVLCIIVIAAILTTFIAVASPTKKIEKTSIIDVVNAGRYRNVVDTRNVVKKASRPAKAAPTL